MRSLRVDPELDEKVQRVFSDTLARAHTKR